MLLHLPEGVVLSELAEHAVEDLAPEFLAAAKLLRRDVGTQAQGGGLVSTKTGIAGDVGVEAATEESGELAREIVAAFLSANFIPEAKYIRRLNKIKALDGDQSGN